MEKAYNIYYYSVKNTTYANRVDIYTDSIEEERKEHATRLRVNPKDIVFKYKHLKEKWDDITYPV